MSISLFQPLMGFQSRHLPFPGGKPREAHYGCSEMAADGMGERDWCSRPKACRFYWSVQIHFPPFSIPLFGPQPWASAEFGQQEALMGVRGWHESGKEGVLDLCWGASGWCLPLLQPPAPVRVLSLHCSPPPSSRPGDSSSSPEMLVSWWCTTQHHFPSPHPHP